MGGVADPALSGLSLNQAGIRPDDNARPFH